MLANAKVELDSIEFGTLPDKTVKGKQYTVKKEEPLKGSAMKISTQDNSYLQIQDIKVFANRDINVEDDFIISEACQRIVTSLSNIDEFAVHSPNILNIIPQVFEFIKKVYNKLVEHTKKNIDDNNIEGTGECLLKLQKINENFNMFP